MNPISQMVFKAQNTNANVYLKTRLTDLHQFWHVSCGLVHVGVFYSFLPFFYAFTQIVVSWNELET